MWPIFYARIFYAVGNNILIALVSEVIDGWGGAKNSQEFHSPKER